MLIDAGEWEWDWNKPRAHAIAQRQRQIKATSRVRAMSRKRYSNGFGGLELWSRFQPSPARDSEPPPNPTEFLNFAGSVCTAASPTFMRPRPHPRSLHSILAVQCHSSSFPSLAMPENWWKIED